MKTALVPSHIHFLSIVFSLACILLVTNAVQANKNRILSQAELEIGLRKCYHGGGQLEANLKYQSSSIRSSRPSEASGIDVKWDVPHSTAFISYASSVSTTLVFLAGTISGFGLTATAAGILGQIGAVAGFLGPIGNGIAVLVYLTGSITDQESGVMLGIQATRKMLDEIGWRFSTLDDKLENMELVIEKTVMYSTYKANQDRIEDVMLKFKAFSKSPGKVTLEEFRDACRQKDPHLSLAWIHRQVVYEQIGAQLMTTVLMDIGYNRTQLRQWNLKIIKDVLMAAFLREACLGARFGPKLMGGAETAVEGSARNPKFEFLCAVNFGRKDADSMTKDIARKLDAAETALMEDFGAAALTNDLRRLILQHHPSEPVCNEPNGLLKKTLSFLQRKYPWVRWWVNLAKKKIEVTSLQGHFVQVEARIGMNNYFLIAAYSEVDTVTPPLDSLSWEIGTAVEFWEKNPLAYIERDRHDFYDNVVLVKSSPSQYHCDFTAPKFAFFKEKKTGKRLSGVGAKEGQFFFYYKFPALASTFTCRASSGELEKLKVKRPNHCDGEAFSKVVQSTMAFYASKLNLANPKGRTELTSNLYNFLSRTYTEFHWTVYVGEPSPIIVLSCDGGGNCARWDWTGSGKKRIPVVAVWTLKCDLKGFVESANKFFLWTQKIQREAFLNHSNPLEALSNYLQDPFTYIRKRGMTHHLEELRSVRKFYAGSKVIFINEVDEKSAWNMNVQLTQQNGAQCQLQLPSKEKKAHFVFVRVDFFAHYDQQNWCRVKKD